MKKTITNRTHHPQYIQLFLAVLFLVLSAGQSLQAQQNEQSRQEVSADRIFSGEDLRQINPVNLWEAIKQLEPSLSESDEESYGSDPNHIPDGINLRGSHHWPSQSAQPVFILDNAIVDARRIRDLNINEIAELAIRKDAATLTTYGLRGSNPDHPPDLRSYPSFLQFRRLFQTGRPQ